MLPLRASGITVCLAVTSLLGALVSTANGDPDASPPAQPAAPVKATKVVEQVVPVELHAIGSTTAKASVTIMPRIDSQLTRALIDDGDAVRRGQLLFRLDPAPLQAAVDQARGALARDKAQANNAAVQARRYRDLACRKLVARQEAEQYEATARALTATVRADKAVVKAARVQLGYAKIRSPISGRVGKVLVDPGNVVKANTTELAVVNQITPIHVDFTVPEPELGRVRQALARASLAVTVVPPGGGKSSSGVLVFIDNQVNAQTGTILLRAELPNTDERLWPGQFVDVTLVLAREKGLVVPARAVQPGQQGSFVYVVGNDGRAQPRPVTVARTVGDLTVVARGLAAGEQVVTDGQQDLAPGMPVRIVPGQGP